MSALLSAHSTHGKASQQVSASTPPTPPPSRDTAILGVGSPLMGDDAAGIWIVEHLRQHADLPPGVDVIDGGTDGVGLVPVIENYRRVILVDAVRMALPPGTIRRFTWAEVQAQDHARALSLHQSDLADALLLAEALDILPGEVVIYGIQPQNTDWDDPISAPVARALPVLLDALLEEARRDF